jgi:hypothetical protein
MATVWSVATDLVHVHTQLWPVAHRSRVCRTRRSGLWLGRRSADRKPVSSAHALALLAAFFAAASLGSVLGVLLGGVIAARWGWKPRSVLSAFRACCWRCCTLKVRDYRTVELNPVLNRVPTRPAARRSSSQVAASFAHDAVGVPGRRHAADRRVRGVGWLPSYLNRFHGMAPTKPQSSGAGRAVRRGRQCCVGQSSIEPAPSARANKLP